jgi:hypothetical protein
VGWGGEGELDKFLEERRGRERRGGSVNVSTWEER